MDPTIYLRGWADLDEPIHYNESDLRHTYLRKGENRLGERVQSRNLLHKLPRYC